MTEYFNVTTNLGDAEIANAIATNTKLNITHIAFGDGNGAVPNPSKSRTTLVHEVHRQLVTKYERHKTNANWIVIETIIPSNIGGFTIREMGLIANDKLISHGSHAPFEKVADPTGVSEYRLKFTQNVRDGSVVEITLDESLIYASQAWVDENYIPRDEIIDNLTTNDGTKPVSAKQAKILNEAKLGKNENAASASKILATRIGGGSDLNDYITEGFYFCDSNLEASNTLNTPTPWAYSLEVIFTAGIIQRYTTYSGGGHNVYIRSLYTNEWTAWKKLAWTTDDIKANADTATKLKSPRKINGIDFDGTQPIDIEAPLTYRGGIQTLQQLDLAIYDGKYVVTELAIAGLYTYGFLVVLRSGGTCHQIYYPHRNNGIPNGGAIAMRQTWNINGQTATWAEWQVIGTRDDSKLPLAGGTVSGDLGLGGSLKFTAPEANLHHTPSAQYFYLNSKGWGVWSPQGSVALPIESGGTGNGIGRAISANHLFTARKVYGQLFDGSSDLSGTVTASTGMIQSDPFHYIDMGRDGVDRINFVTSNAIFNFMNPLGTIVARISSDGIDCNAASATKLVSFRIGGGSDLNNYKTEGHYYCDSDAETATTLNTPNNWSYSLEVIKTAGIVQRLTNYKFGGNNVYIRSFYETDGWSTWRKLAFTDDNITGNAASASKLQNPRQIFGQTFDGSSDLSGSVTASTGMIQSDPFHYIDMGRNGIDRMNFVTSGAVFNFMNAVGTIVARISLDGIDCNAASASKLQTARKINGIDFDGSKDINIFNQQTGDAPFFGVRAFISFNGTGSIAISGSKNIANIVDDGVGNYTVNFITPMRDDTYTVVVSGARSLSATAVDGHRSVYKKTTTSFSIKTQNTEDARDDHQYISAIVID